MPDRPDAVMAPPSIKVGKTVFIRVNRVLDFVEPLLQVDASKGEKGHVRTLYPPDGRLFITRDPRDTVYFPKLHDREGQPRYNWVDSDNGVQLGYLVETVDA